MTKTQKTLAIIVWYCFWILTFATGLALCATGCGDEIHNPIPEPQPESLTVCYACTLNGQAFVCEPDRVAFGMCDLGDGWQAVCYSEAPSCQ